MHIHIANFDGANVRKILKRSFAQDTGNGECLCWMRDKEENKWVNE